MNKCVREISLVLSGTDVRGMAHIGLNMTLKEYKFNISAILGNSIKSMVGAMHGSWKNIDEMHYYF